MKIILLILFFPIILNAQIRLTNPQDLAFDYYRATAITLGTALISDQITDMPILSCLIGLALGIGQGLIFERGQQGKIVSCFGATGGAIGFTVHWNIRTQKENKQLLKLKPNDR